MTGVTTWQPAIVEVTCAETPTTKTISSGRDAEAEMPYFADRLGFVAVLLCWLEVAPKSPGAGLDIFPVFSLELICRGEVVASTTDRSGAKELRLSERLRVDRPGWICARVGGGGPHYLTRHRDERRRAIMARSSPVYVRCGAEGCMSDLAAIEYLARLGERGSRT